MGRQRRWSRASAVACLVVLLFAACAESARPGRMLAAASEEGLPAAGASMSGTDDGDGDGGQRRSAFDVLVEGLVSIGLGRRWRAGAVGDKRRVPTGPNPLHNR